MRRESSPLRHVTLAMPSGVKQLRLQTGKPMKLQLNSISISSGVLVVKTFCSKQPSSLKLRDMLNCFSKLSTMLVSLVKHSVSLNKKVCERGFSEQLRGKSTSVAVVPLFRVELLAATNRLLSKIAFKITKTNGRSIFSILPLLTTSIL